MIERIKNLISNGESQKVEFKEATFESIKYVEELGSGISKIFKYCHEFSHHNPVIEDGTTFKFSLQHDFFPEHIKTNSGKQASLFDLLTSDQVSDQVFLEKEMLEFCIEPKSLTEILARFGLSSRNHFRQKTLNPLIKKCLIKATQPNSPNSPTQKYVTVMKNEDNND